MKTASAPVDAYRAKRSFERAPDPPPNTAAKARKSWSRLSFVVQKHDARHLHYGLRLEFDGVLKSWPVTRGPSLVPVGQRFAVETEDHPMKYLDFEGVIPAGEYGGGTMIVWDRGTSSPEGDPRRGFAKGHLDFTLAGERLEGRWHLVRMRARLRETKDQWLLIKSDDDFARSEEDPDLVEEQSNSVKSSKTNGELAAAGAVCSDHTERQARKAGAKSVAAPAPKGARKGLMATFVDPMLATLTAPPPTGVEWIHEIKFDGYHIQAQAFWTPLSPRSPPVSRSAAATLACRGGKVPP